MAKFNFFKEIRYFLLAAVYFFPAVLLAAEPKSFKESYFERLKTAAGVGAGGFGEVGETTLAARVGGGIGALLVLVGTIFLVLVVYGGVNWMLARGNEEKITKSKTIIIDASIGLGITMAAYIITRTIVAIFV
ncbi:MAG: hypothetical protein PHD51_04215 [Patescibacteria group bacterium]|nr:hypothetical protein [Patescibacteria group bacterium]MDD5490829.1 hypothetical protein [Patescibacteria group bacterium]